jgi:CDP-paratose 2-epimerase
VIDAAASASVLAGVDGRTSLRQLMEHNLVGTLHVLEYCAQHRAGLILLSSSRVYSMAPLASLPVREVGGAYRPDESRPLPAGVSAAGLAEGFPVEAPVSPYGASKLASEIVALEYGATCGFPVWVNRCGVLAGAGQFGTAEQGIFSYWIHAHAGRRRLRYTGFGGKGWQVRDALHMEDLGALVAEQIRRGRAPENPVYNIGGGAANAMSLAQLTAWCDARFGTHAPEAELRSRPFDAPWIVMDSGRARGELGWTPQRPLESILEEIAAHARENPGWLEGCGA